MLAPSRLTELLGIAHPVLLAPMAGVSGGRLAAAVSAAGGLGFLGGGYCDGKWLQEQLALCGDAPVGVGFITWALRVRPELLQAALLKRPRALFLSFGAIDGFAAQVLDAGAVLIVQVQTVAQAREAIAQGAQVIVAQGGEAGGHGGWRGTMALVPAVVDAAGDVPVVAAGGIADGRGMAAALMLGASGVLCGTAFYAAIESLAHEASKQRLIDASGDDTVKSPVFDIARGIAWPDGPWQLRTLRNHYTQRWANDLTALKAAIAKESISYAQARSSGDFDVAATIVGEAADLVPTISPAAQIIQLMVDQCDQLLSQNH